MGTMTMAATAETCAMCGQAIAPDDIPYLVRDRVVCAACYDRVHSPTAAPADSKPRAPTDQLLGQYGGYPEIVAGAKTLGLLASLVAAIGWVYVIVGMVAGFLAIAGHEMLTGLGIILGALLVALLFFGAAVLLRMLGSIGLAIRDIAMK